MAAAVQVHPELNTKHMLHLSRVAFEVALGANFGIKQTAPM